MPLRAIAIARAGNFTERPFDSVALDASERHLRRKLITLNGGSEVLVDLETPVRLNHQDCLVLEDGRLAQVLAAEEPLLEVTAQNLARIAWHIGNRHLEAQIEARRILIHPDHVIANMLEQLGAEVHPVREPFTPEHGAYHLHDH